MRRFTNFYIILFLTTAGLSLSQAFWLYFAEPQPVVSVLSKFSTILLNLYSLLVFSLLGVDRRLPKRIFLPMTLYVFWASLGLWPLLGQVPFGFKGVVVACGQLVIAGLVLLVLRRSYGSLLLPEEIFRQPRFSWANTLIFSVVNVLLLPVLLVFSLLATADLYLESQTAGFMRLSPIGAYASERRYRYGGKEVRLVAMMHIARPGYYQELVASLPAKGTIVLAEGVSDRDSLLKNKFSYERLAGLAGLRSQETMRLEGNILDLDDLKLTDGVARDETKPDIVQADLDVNLFAPGTVEFLNVIGQTLLSGKPLEQGIVAYFEWVQAHAGSGVLEGVWEDILERRNAVVIDTLWRSLDRYDTIIVPWGGMHMPGIEKAMLKGGFVPAEDKERLLFSFSTFFQGQ